MYFICFKLINNLNINKIYYIKPSNITRKLTIILKN